jgi:hypothetical protein
MKVLIDSLAPGESRPVAAQQPAQFPYLFNHTTEYRCQNNRCDAVVNLNDADDLVITLHTDYGGDTTCYVCWVCPGCGNHNDVLNLGYYTPTGPDAFIERITSQYPNRILTIPESAVRAAFARFRLTHP